jgi:hypothetical protein
MAQNNVVLRFDNVDFRYGEKKVILDESSFIKISLSTFYDPEGQCVLENLPDFNAQPGYIFF